MKPATTLRPATWIFLRSAGSRWTVAHTATAAGRPMDPAAASNLRTEIQHARSEGAGWQDIADAALLAVETIKQLATKEATA